MPSSLTIDDFKPVTVTCELRYENAYRAYDQTGQILEDLREGFTDIKVSLASPPQTDFTAEEGNFTLSIATSRLTASRHYAEPETFGKHCKNFFDVVGDRLGLTVFTRIGLRYILRRDYKTEDDAKAALASLGLANLSPPKRFNSSDSPTEIAFRWEDSQIGALVRLKAEKVEIKLAVPPELEDTLKPVDKKQTFLTFDVDYYTVAPVNRDQWNPEEWIPQKLRIIRKESDGILHGGK